MASLREKIAKRHKILANVGASNVKKKKKKKKKTTKKKAKKK
jgi:hypothetical protein